MPSATTWNRRLGRGLLYALLVAGGAAMLFPFAWMLSTAFQTEGALLVPPPKLIPSPIELGNFRGEPWFVNHNAPSGPAVMATGCMVGSV